MVAAERSALETPAVIGAGRAGAACGWADVGFEAVLGAVL